MRHIAENYNWSWKEAKEANKVMFKKKDQTLSVWIKDGGKRMTFLIQPKGTKKKNFKTNFKTLEKELSVVSV